MIVNPLTGLFATAGAQNATKVAARVQDTLQELLGIKTKPVSDVADLSAAAALQNNVANLRSANTNIAENLSRAQVIEEGIGNAALRLEKLQALATQASDETISAPDRAALNAKFEAELKALNATVDKTTFGGEKVLDGSLTEKNALSINRALGIAADADQGKLEVPALDAKALLGKVDLKTVENARAAFDATKAAAKTLERVFTDVKAFEATLEFAGATLDSAIFTQDALRASFTADDLLPGNTGFVITDAIYNAELARRAQENRLPPSLVQLIS